MHIEINDKTTLQEIQDVFSNFYPYLQLNFYKKAHKIFESSPDADLIPPDKKVSEIKKAHVSGLLEIQPLYKVAEVEKEFQQRFGLSVQVLRKEEDGWVQTTGMDDFTLKYVNEMSRNASDEFIVNEEEEEFDESDELPNKLL
jgi:glycerol-3-phosphate O-acyltransferase